jgi:hypothetical protein
MSLRILVAVGIAATAVASGASPADARPKAVEAGTAVVNVGRASVGRAVPAGFVGLSLELPSLLSYAGKDPQAINPVFEQLIRNLAPGQSASLRLGGDSTDWTWYAVPHITRPPWVRYTLTQNWLQVARSLAQAVNARLILGINLEANSAQIAGAEARAMIATIGRGLVAALEIGNEPELYGSFSWYRTPSGGHVRGRAPAYAFSDFTRDFSKVARALPQIPLAGPSIGSPAWQPQLATFFAAEPRVGVATLHRYPLKRCAGRTNVTVGQLLSETSSIGLADSAARYAALAHARGHRLRIDEMNSISCGGQRGVSDTFASALWALDALFAMQSVGVDGVNIHTLPGAVNELFAFNQVNGVWQGYVRPDYYGLLMFAQAAPAGSRLLKLSGTTRGTLRAWATLAPDRHARVVLINASTTRSQAVTVKAPSAAGSATLEQLTAPNATAKSGITLGGQSFGSPTATGLLAGNPQPASLAHIAGSYRLRLPPASAAMLTMSQ